MAIRDVFKITRKTFVNPAGWLGYESLKAQNRTIWTILKDVFTPEKPLREESFSEAIQRLNLSEQDIQHGAVYYRWYALGFVAIGLLDVFYSFFLLFQYHAWLGWLLGMAVSTIFFAQAFKYDFWSLQMRKRQLGISFAEWKVSILGDK